MVDDCEKWSIATLKQFLEERLDAVEKQNASRLERLEALSQERVNQVKTELASEREVIRDKIHSANMLKETFGERLNKLANDSLKRDEVDTKFGAMQDKIDLLNRTNWPLYTSFGGIAVSVVVGLWVVIGLQIAATVQPVVVSLEQVKISDQSRDRSISDFRAEYARDQTAGNTENAQKTRDISNLQQNAEASKVDRQQLNERIRSVESSVNGSLQADANSKTDRQQLNERLHQLETSMATNTADRRSTESSLKASLSEIEGQICSQDSIRNLSHASDLRVMGLMWNRLGMGIFPNTTFYFPEICNKTLYSTSTPNR